MKSGSPAGPGEHQTVAWGMAIREKEESMYRGNNEARRQNPAPMNRSGRPADRLQGEAPRSRRNTGEEIAMNARSDHQLAWTTFLLILAVLLAACVNSGCGSSRLSDEPIDDPSSIPATFVVGKVADESAGRTLTRASAVFKGEGLTTIRLLGGSVELLDPRGNLHPMELSYNRLGAPYYTACLSEPLELDAIYSFRVTLPGGRMIENAIKTPRHDLEILSPAMGSTIDRWLPVELSWSGWNDRKALILIGPEEHTILDPFETGGKLAEDDGSTVLLPESLLNLERGRNLLSVARIDRTPANGFHRNSTVGAVLLATRPIFVD